MASARISAPAAVATAAVVLTLAAAMVLIGPPSRERQRRLDMRRAEDLNRLSAMIDEYWDRRKALPVALDSLVSDHQLNRVPHDPVTNAAYPFTVVAPKTFRLCATFEQPSDDESGPFSITLGGQRSWRHGVGSTCFDLQPRERH